MLRLWIDTQFNSSDDVGTLRYAIAHPGVEIVGISTVGSEVATAATAVREFFENANRAAPLIYAGPPDPRALDMAEAILAIGPLTNLAMLLRAGIALVPTVVTGVILASDGSRTASDVANSNFGIDPLSAAVVVAEATDLLLTPTHICETIAARMQGPLALLALLGELVQIEKRSLAVTVEGLLVIDDRDGVEHDLVVWADAAAAQRRMDHLNADFGVA